MSTAKKVLAQKTRGKDYVVGDKRPPVEYQFKPGNLANPGGKPVGTRNRLQGGFMRDLADDWDAHGKLAIQQCREKSPETYIRVVASLMPKELEIKQPLDELSEDELIAGVAALQLYLSRQPMTVINGEFH